MSDNEESNDPAEAQDTNDNSVSFSTLKWEASKFQQQQFFSHSLLSPSIRTERVELKSKWKRNRHGYESRETFRVSSQAD